ncbi:unnamed protein product [Paramecium sonneborni]|uniref:Uncharacterized protein n=1 Tax=Paramecium sonneborni TaxID=65129 RepID=A0A8S1QY97_9CILI|nr:unnamed protein product [Paramecium sonneborni]
MQNQEQDQFRPVTIYNLYSKAFMILDNASVTDQIYHIFYFQFFMIFDRKSDPPVNKSFQPLNFQSIIGCTLDFCSETVLKLCTDLTCYLELQYQISLNELHLFYQQMEIYFIPLMTNQVVKLNKLNLSTLKEQMNVLYVKKNVKFKVLLELVVHYVYHKLLHLLSYLCWQYCYDFF